MVRRVPTGFTFCLLFSLSTVIITSSAAFARPVQPPPPAKSANHTPPGAFGEERAYRLFKLAQLVNPVLRWDNCLARKARQRAKTMVETGVFSHRDPKTGKNPAWSMVADCHPCRRAAENLARSREIAEAVHCSLMESARHRENIVNPRYSLMGVGCHEDICVEFFAGF